MKPPHPAAPGSHRHVEDYTGRLTRSEVRMSREYGFLPAACSTQRAMGGSLHMRGVARIQCAGAERSGSRQRGLADTRRPGSHSSSSERPGPVTRKT